MRYDVDGGLATITMDHVENRNALTAELVTGLGTNLERAIGDAHVRVILLTNEGPAFSAGADLKSGRGATPGGEYTMPQVLTLMLDAPKPVVGRIAGHCMGGGVGLAAACDLSIAADDVRFGFTEVRVGVAPAVISVVVLPKLRRGDALELFLTGERISASRAAEVGLISQCVPRESLDKAVSDTLSKLVAGGPQALAAAKQLIRDVPSLNRDDAFSWTAQRSAELFGSEEAAEGMAAFRDRRPASWAPGGGG